MATFDPIALAALLTSGEITCCEQLLGFAAEPLMELAGGSQYIPIINGARDFEYRTYQDFDGTGNLRTFVQMAIPSDMTSFGTAAPKWKAILNSVPGAVPARYYTPTA